MIPGNSLEKLSEDLSMTRVTQMCPLVGTENVYLLGVPGGQTVHTAFLLKFILGQASTGNYSQSFTPDFYINNCLEVS